VCQTGTLCTAGGCQPITCSSGQTLCGNDCVNLELDSLNCGACQNACRAGDALKPCVGGVCQP
jgi:hypothetical protein